jgi:AraC-like DNA-binding protein
MSGRVSSVSRDLPRMMLDFAAREGIRLPDELSAAAAAAPERVSMAECDSIWREISDRSGDPALALRFGEAAAQAMGGHVVFAVMLNSASLGDALDGFRRYHGLIADGAGPERREEGTARVYSIAPGAGIGRPYATAILAMMARAVDRLSGGRARPLEIRFSGPAPAELSEFERVFGAPLSFGRAEDGIALNRADLDLPVALADPALLAWLERFARAGLERGAAQGSWPDRASAAIESRLISGQPPLVGAIASELALSPRRLQRELSAAGASFRDILDGVRARMAREMLERGGTELHEIAFLLGFSEQSAFNRAFKRWTGQSPLAFARSGDAKAEKHRR